MQNTNPLTVFMYDDIWYHLSSKIQNVRQNDVICKKMAIFHTLLAY